MGFSVGAWKSLCVYRRRWGRFEKFLFSSFNFFYSSQRRIFAVLWCILVSACVCVCFVWCIFVCIIAVSANLVKIYHSRQYRCASAKIKVNIKLTSPGLNSQTGSVQIGRRKKISRTSDSRVKYSHTHTRARATEQVKWTRREREHANETKRTNMLL